MTDMISLAVLTAVIGGAAFYIYKAKKSGAKCIGCPMSKQCSSCGCGCGGSK